jgi:ribulose-5-phosphate 4-epimerase/fuculose-1-phosphate aldolase
MSARIPGPEDHMLLNPMSHRYEEITAAALQKLDREANHVIEHPERPHHFAFAIHRALLDAIPEANCFVHLHSKNGIAVACQEEGLRPISQFAMMVGEVGYHPYEGLAPTAEELGRAAKNFNGTKVLIMRRHGIFTWGRTISEAFWVTFHVERACEIQIAALGGGAEVIDATPEVVAGTAGRFTDPTHPDDNRVLTTSWDAALRLADRLDPGFRE